MPACERHCLEEQRAEQQQNASSEQLTCAFQVLHNLGRKGRALETRCGPGLKNPEFSRRKAKFLAARVELTGDPELDEADLKYQRFMRAEIVKRLPELADHFRDELTHYEAWTARVAEANALAREIKALETTPAVHARSK